MLHAQTTDMIEDVEPFPRDPNVVFKELVDGCDRVQVTAIKRFNSSKRKNLVDTKSEIEISRLIESIIFTQERSGIYSLGCMCDFGYYYHFRFYKHENILMEIETVNFGPFHCDNIYKDEDLQITDFSQQQLLEILGLTSADITHP